MQFIVQLHTFAYTFTQCISTAPFTCLYSYTMSKNSLKGQRLRCDKLYFTAKTQNFVTQQKSVLLTAFILPY